MGFLDTFRRQPDSEQTIDGLALRQSYPNAGYRLSENVEDRRADRHPGDYNQRMMIRADLAEQELRNGIAPDADYTREDVINWLDKNAPIGESLGQSAAAVMDMQDPLPGYSQQVQPIYGVTDGMYPLNFARRGPR